MRELGLTTPQLASSLRAYVNGDVATYWTSPDGEQVEVRAAPAAAAQRENIAQIDDLPVAYAKDGTPIALARVADIVPVVNPDVIKRQDLQRRQAIYAGVAGPAGGRRRRRRAEDRQGDAAAARLPLRRRRPDQGAGRRPSPAMLAALALAVIFIYIVLASQFGSFLQPIAIMASLPLALIGVMLALLL